MQKSKKILLGKVLIVGISGVGKSQLVNRFANDRFEMESDVTVQPTEYNKNLSLDKTTVRLTLFDTAGQD